MKNDASRPHTSSGCSSKSSGPGWMPLISERAEQHGGGGAAGDAEGERRHEVGVRRGVVGALRRGDALDGAVAELVALFFDTRFSMP